ncbi:ABC transporter substrate-binding protein [Xylophilus rhododendri]|uniref:ABC transporter substrate-binding protein n=1 Tax=Xylophilus rhododendri TaxID=2697032 RepID=A0A857J1V8_9BURK|nr:ABC transporter substrate-binding protein [Xylophilus rhododendri]QHI96855.1 ABC transporter substrate-binding protein [Xylophilus rhododendri]
MTHTLRVGAISRNYFNMPLWIAQDQGLFAEQGLDVAIELFEPIDEVTTRLNDGRLDLALGVTEHVILAAETGGDLTVIAGNVNRLPFSLIARPEIRSVEQLRGQVVGVSSLQAGSSSLVMKMLTAHGLECPRDYTLEAVGPILARWERLQRGEIAAGLQGIPLNYMALDAGYRSLGEPREQFPWFQFTSLNVSARWAGAHRAETEAFVRAWVAAHAWFYGHPKECTAIAMRHTGIDEGYAERAWRDYTQDEIFPRDGAADPRGIQTLIDISALIRALPGRAKTRAEDYIDGRYLEATRQAA